MAILIVESFSWSALNGGSLNVLATRYNATPGGGNIAGAAGRFQGDALSMGGNNFQGFNLRSVVAPTIRVGFAMKCNLWSGSGGSSEEICSVLDGATKQVFITVNAVSKKVEVRNGANTLLGTGTTVLQNNSYHYFEFLTTINATTGTFSLAVDGITQLTLTNVSTQASGVNQVTQVRLRGLAAAATNFFCDFMVADAGPLAGEMRVSLLTPTSDGSASAWTPSTGTALFSLVDEIPPNGDTDYISSTIPTQEALFGYSDLSYAPASVMAVQVSLYARKDDAVARAIAAEVRTGGTTFAGASQSITSTYLDFYLEIWPVNPSTLAAWTGAQVNALEAGVVCTL